jgi:cytochrome c heme-lyase
MVRKQKVEGAAEEDMESVVKIHNNMNEATWNQILEWEKLHPDDSPGKDPKLLRFLGKPDDLSPKARLKALFGHAEPFDRHDWIVDRGGKEVRYVIDYYHDEAGASADTTPKDKNDFSAVKSIKLDVRPALDSFSSFFDRVIKMPYHEILGKTAYKALPFFTDSATIQAEKQQIQRIKNTWEVIRKNCEIEKQKMIDCKSEQECMNASIALQACTAKVVCPQIAKDFEDSLQVIPYEEEKTEQVYNYMVKCLELFEIDSKSAFSKSSRK